MRIFSLLVLGTMMVTQLPAQDKEKVDTKDRTDNSIQFKLKNSEGMVIIIDGKRYDSDIARLIDPDKIESVTVLKGKEAEEQYNSPGGVIVITSKNEDGEDYKVKTKIKLRNSTQENYPMVILDGKVVTREELGKIDPNTIDKIEVFKGEQAIEKYNAENGVIVVKTKKKK